MAETHIAAVAMLNLAFPCVKRAWAFPSDISTVGHGNEHAGLVRGWRLEALARHMRRRRPTFDWIYLPRSSPPPAAEHLDRDRLRGFPEYSRPAIGIAERPEPRPLRLIAPAQVGRRWKDVPPKENKAGSPCQGLELTPKTGGASMHKCFEPWCFRLGRSSQSIENTPGQRRCESLSGAFERRSQRRRPTKLSSSF